MAVWSADGGEAKTETPFSPTRGRAGFMGPPQCASAASALSSPRVRGLAHAVSMEMRTGLGPPV